MQDSRHGSYDEVWRLAYPAILTMLSQTVMWTVDSAMVGHVGKVELAAVGLGGIMVWTTYSFFVGLTYSVNTYVSQYFGKGRFKDCGRNLWQGLYIALAAGLFIYVVRFFNPEIIRLLGPAGEVERNTLAYADIRMLSAPFAVLQFAYSNFFRGIGNTKTPMKVVAFANLFNIIGDYFLIFGKGPFPAMGVAGAAVSTAIANFLAAGAFAVISLSRPYREKYDTHRAYRFVYSETRKLLKIGLPIGIHFLLDMASFLVFFAYVGRIGTAPLAANQIIIQVLAFSFMPAQGFGIAATTLMGQHIGGGRSDSAKKSAHSALKLGLFYAIGLGIAFILFASPIVEIFTSDREVMELGRRMMLLAAVFQLFDTIQMIASGALRGAGDTKAPMIITVSFAWMLFLPLAFLFGTVLGWGVVGAWVGAVCYIAVLGTVMFARLERDRWKSITI
jgi:putative MATE family efflux protein